MSFASRLASVKSPPVQLSTRRTYSILTKSGGGRFFTASKPPKTLAASSNPGSSTTSSSNPALKAQESSPESNPIAPNAVKESSVDTEAHESTRDGLTNATSSSSTEAGELEKDTPSQSTSSATASSRREQPRTSTTLFAEESSLHHPRPPQDQVLLHSFFSLHRPLLLLPMHAQQPLFNKLSSTGTIFSDVNFSGASLSHQEQEAEEMKSLYNDVNGAAPFEVDMGTGKLLHLQDGQIQYGEEDVPEADADAARLLGRTYVVNQIGSFVDWQNVLKTLGDSQAKKEIDGIKAAAHDMVANADEAEVVMDSVKRKRRRKMNKHIYKKRRKRERAQRRRLGK